jgi:ATP/maltotriose-dependent transcriptional regulator MalT
MLCPSSGILTLHPRLWPLFSPMQVRDMQPLFPVTPALLEQLDGGMTHLLTLLVAPAGSGKSALLRCWAATRNWPVAWVALQTGDNDLACLVRHLVTASEVLDPNMRLLPGRKTPAPQDSLTEWLNALAVMREDFALILDGYERIESLVAHQAVGRILDYPPPRLHLFIASRAEPPLPLPRLRVRRQLLQVFKNR